MAATPSCEITGHKLLRVGWMQCPEALEGHLDHRENLGVGLMLSAQSLVEPGFRVLSQRAQRTQRNMLKITSH